MNTSKHRWRLITAATAVGAVVGLAAAMPATAAGIQELPNGTDSASLTIHKSSAAPTTPGDGTEIAAPTPAIEGAEFTVYPVEFGGAPLDLLTNAGWAQAATLAATLGADPFEVDALVGDTVDAITDDVNDVLAGVDADWEAVEADGVTVTTDATGTAVFTPTPATSRGLYLVVETGLPVGASEGAAPFLVTLPTATADGSDWLYAVHVYPKNQVEYEAEKTVSDTGAVVLGDEISFSVSSEVPAFATTDYVVTDDLVAAGVTYVPASATVTVDGVAVDPADFTAVVSSGVLTVTFLTDAITAINAAEPGDPIVVSFDATVDAAGELSNTANVIVNSGTPLATPGVDYKWGGLQVTKKNDDDDVLAGATFAVFLDEADALAADIDDPLTLATAIDFDGGDDTSGILFESDVDGLVDFGTVRYSTWADGEEIADELDYQTYYVIELEAPAGYEVNTTPTAINVGDLDDEISTGVYGADVIDVPTVPGFQLPLTGGAGTAIFYTVGGAAIALTVVLFVVFGAKRRKEHEEI